MLYKIPEINNILKPVIKQEQKYDEENLIKQGKLLIFLLNNFNVSAQVCNICPGPIITRYELKLGTGVRTKEIENLSNDLAMGLKAKSIRIVLIPEKSVIGVEIPNKNPQIVYLKDIITSSEFKPTEGINLILGKDTGDKPIMTDLTTAPHMLVAGQTGSGKSMEINSFLITLLATKTPYELRMIMIDPKIVELSPYNGIPHLLAPVITSSYDAIKILNWVAKAMDERYELLSQHGARNIKNYNIKEINKMPYIVVIIDEMADLIMATGKNVENLIVRIAQKARAVGIHLILTTQRPSVNVITGLIKANVPTRIGFQTASQIDSRIIIDKSGCENLLGCGDMLFNDVTSPEPQRIHGTFIDYEDVDTVIAACSNQIPQKFVKFDEDISITIHDEPTKQLLEHAMELLKNKNVCSPAYLQRKMNISYNLANKILHKIYKTA